MTQSNAPNPTAAKFGYPHTLVRNYGHWVVLTRPQQCTLGALVLVCTDDAQSFSSIEPEAYGELERVVGNIERGLTQFRPYRKINYLMLMMKDRDVHFHVVPRYDGDQKFEGETYSDAGWPGVPDLGSGPTPDADMLAQLTKSIRQAWGDNGA
ncbi:MAG: HIT family protein [Alphaproteobacteria bacterium]|nr:HIT family protein [Alphaproteobacteria bacterium]